MNKPAMWGAIAGLLIAGAGVIFWRKSDILYLVLVISVFVAILPYVMGVIFQNSRGKEIDERFLEFVRDLIENVKSGTPISKAIINIQKRDYGVLSKHVNKLASQIALGIPIQKALDIFAHETKSRVVKRSVSLISEAQKAGGDIEHILGSVAKSVNQTEQLKKEQKAAVYNLIVQGYIIFIVFIIIMLVLQYYILPMTANLGNIDDLNIGGGDISTPEDFSSSLITLLLVQSFFAGLVIGKISEGSLKSGIKHSFILLAIALLVTTGAQVLLG